MVTTVDVPRGLERAMELFWKQGATETAYGDIVAATGLSRKALYGAWQDKDQLVHATLERYRDTVLRDRIALLSPPGAQALARFWTALEDEARQLGWCGCYLFRTAAGTMKSDLWVRRLQDQHVQDLQEALVRAILAARRDFGRARVLDAGAAAWQAVSLVTLASGLGSASGYDARVAELYRAGRLACGLPPA